MRPASLIFITILLISCRQIKNTPDQKELDIIDTEMADIKPFLKVTKKDSIRVINFWHRFKTLLEKNNTKEIYSLSLKNVYCPVYDNYYNYYFDSKLVPLYIFQNAPYRNQYTSRFSFSLTTLIPKIYLDELSDIEMDVLRFQKNKTINKYIIHFNTEEVSGNYKFWRSHDFEFVDINDSLKFAGLNVDEIDSRYQYNQISCDSLYFPLIRNNQDSITNTNSMDTFSNKWYSRVLTDFKEPNLTANFYTDVYRFTWLRSFHNPIVIRFEKSDNTFTLTTKELIDFRGYKPQEITVNRTKELSGYEWTTLEDKLKKLNFWVLKSNETNPDESTDGALWILEGVTGDKLFGKYHFTNRHSPNNKNYTDCCKYFLSLSGLKIPEGDIY